MAPRFKLFVPRSAFPVPTSPAVRDPLYESLALTPAQLEALQKYTAKPLKSGKYDYYLECEAA